MLVLSRKVGETIVIGDDAVVWVRAVRGNRVVIGVAAPQATSVLRGELSPFDATAPVPTPNCSPVALP